MSIAGETVVILTWRFSAKCANGLTGAAFMRRTAAARQAEAMNAIRKDLRVMEEGVRTMRAGAGGTMLPEGARGGSSLDEVKACRVSDEVVKGGGTREG
jgi:hypothetical protein